MESNATGIDSSTIQLNVSNSNASFYKYEFELLNSTGAPEQDLDLSKVLYPGHVKLVPLWEIVVKSVFYVVTIILAFGGNVLVMFIVWRNKRMRTTTNCYIVNLAVSDLMVTVSCTWVHLVDDLSEGWVLGAFFCKFNSFAQVLSLVSSIMTLTLISCDRFFGIVFAMKAHMTERRARTFLIVVWICAIGISSPLLVYRAQFERKWLDHWEIWCDDLWPSRSSRMFYFTFISLVLYFFPILIMSVAYALIIWRLWSSRLPGEHLESEVAVQDKIKKKVVIMLIIILSVFALCWLPFQISILYAEHRTEWPNPLPAWYDKFSYFANYMAYANSAFNPIIYAGFNENFKREFKAIFRCGATRELYSSIGLRRDSSYRSSTFVTRI